MVFEYNDNSQKLLKYKILTTKRITTANRHVKTHCIVVYSKTLYCFMNYTLLPQNSYTTYIICDEMSISLNFK